MLINGWVFFRYMVIGIYVGLATVGVFGVWYTSDSFLGIDLSGDGHSTVTWSQLTNWESCGDGSALWHGFKPAAFTSISGETFDFQADPCSYFTTGKIKASTLSLSVLVTIEMFNALNALSEDGSLVSMPPWVNPYLLIAMALSFGLHFLILYVPMLARIFAIVPLSFEEWLLVTAFSAPVVIIDELLKLIGRKRTEMEEAKREVEVEKMQLQQEEEEEEEEEEGAGTGGGRRSKRRSSRRGKKNQ